MDNEFDDFLNILSTSREKLGLSGELLESLGKSSEYFQNSELLFTAGFEYLSIESLKLFIKNGADINCSDFSNNTVLFFAVQNPSTALEVVKYLLENGAHPDARNSDDEPPLSYCRKLPMAKLLIQYSVVHKMCSLISKDNAESEINLTSNEADQILDLSFTNKPNQSELLRAVRHKQSGSTQYNTLANIRDSCITEIKLMKKDVIAQDYTFFDFITQYYKKNVENSEKKQINVYTMREILLRLYQNKYPSYHDIIYTAIRLSNVDLTKMFDLKMYTANANSLITDSTKRVVSLNTECTYGVLSYLSTEDIVNFILVFGHKTIFESKLHYMKRAKEEKQIAAKRVKNTKN